MKKPNVNYYWQYIIERFPDAVFDFWYSSGELIFYTSRLAENPSSCYMLNGKLTIEHSF